eukprot:COSAG01_NODE_41202_length_454_cov_1.276056_1_plen_36_part_10
MWGGGGGIWVGAGPCPPFLGVKAGGVAGIPPHFCSF